MEEYYLMDPKIIYQILKGEIKIPVEIDLCIENHIRTKILALLPRLLINNPIIRMYVEIMLETYLNVLINKNVHLQIVKSNHANFYANQELI